MAGVCERPRWPGVAIPVEVTRMAPRHLLIALALLGCRVDPGAQSSTPPAGEDTILIAGHALYVPSGFNVNLFAEGLGGVRSLALGPGGAVFATLSGTIVRLVDADGDGIAESRGTVLSGLDYPFGLAFRRDTMYFSEQTTVRRLDPGAATPVTLVLGLPRGGHITRTIAFGPDNLLYVAVGSSCNVCLDAPPRAAVTRYNLNGSNPHTFATGLRNSVGLAFYTGTTFPAAYQGDAFMTYHGSWNRSVPTGAKVVRVRVQSGRPTAIEDFVTGWQLADGSRWGRPVGLLVMPDGALLVSDDYGGRIWRITYGR